MSPADLQRLIRDIPDVPSPGVMFRDITPLLADPVGYDAAVKAIVGLTHGKRVDKVLALPLTETGEP